MAKTRAKKAERRRSLPLTGAIRRVRRWVWRGILGVLMLALVLTLLFAAVNPPTTPYMWREGPVVHEWVDIEDIAPVMARSAVAAEDADFCLHWGIDVRAIQAALDEGAARGGSTISQQVVKNVYLWQGRSWTRKAVEALWTPLTEAIWPKRRILELYLNMIEFDQGVFGVQAAARHYFGVDAADLSARQAAALAAVLPAPKSRDAANLTPGLQRRAASIADGAATIAADGRAECFDPG